MWAIERVKSSGWDSTRGDAQAGQRRPESNVWRQSRQSEGIGPDILDALDLARAVDGAIPLVAMWPPDADEYFARLAGDRWGRTVHCQLLSSG